MTKSTRFARLRRPQASQPVRVPFKPREPVFISSMLAARRREPGKAPRKVRSLDGDYPAVRYLQELRWAEPVDGVRVAGCRPDLLLPQEVLVDEGDGFFGMADRWHPADREPGLLPDVAGVGLLDRLRDELRDLPFVHPVYAAGEDEHGLARPPALEDERFDDLLHPATKGLRHLGGAPRRPIQLHHPGREAPFLQRFADPLHARSRTVRQPPPPRRSLAVPGHCSVRPHLYYRGIE